MTSVCLVFSTSFKEQEASKVGIILCKTVELFVPILLFVGDKESQIVAEIDCSSGSFIF